MPTNVQIPALGESISEATLIKWYKNDGEMVKTDEPLCELETDKANVDLPSPASGVIKRIKPEGAKVKIGDTIATIDPAAKPAPIKPPTVPAGAALKSSSAPQPSKPSPPRDDLSPAVRRLVDENQLDTSTINASGPGGRITKEDVLKYLESRKSDGNGAQTQAEDSRATDADPGEAALLMTAPSATQDGPVHRETMSKIRRKIAE